MAGSSSSSAAGLNSSSSSSLSIPSLATTAGDNRYHERQPLLSYANLPPTSSTTTTTTSTTTSSSTTIATGTNSHAALNHGDVESDQRSLASYDGGVVHAYADGGGSGITGRLLADADDEKEPPRELSKLQIFMFGAPEATFSFMMGASSGWLTYYYLPPDGNETGNIVPEALFFATALFGRIINGLLEPAIGYVSDQTSTRFGRRLPYIFGFAPLAAFTWAMLWHVPFEHNSAGAMGWFVVAFMLNNFFMACVLAPYTSLVPEMTENRKERLTLGSSMGLWGLGGNLVVSMMGPVNDAVKDDFTVFGYPMSGLQLLNTIMAFMIIILCWMPLLFIREKAVLAHQISSHNLFHEMRITFKNPTFRTFMGLLGFWMMGITMWQAILPYLCTEVLAPADGLVPEESGETWTGIYSLISLGGAVLMVPVLYFLSLRFGKKRVMIFAGYTSFSIVISVIFCPYVNDPGIYYLIVMIINAIPVSAYFVLPNILFADVIDYDQQQSGIRREGVYTGVRLFLTRVTIGIGASLIVPLLTFGNSADDYLGIILVFPVSATFFLIATIIFHFHALR